MLKFENNSFDHLMEAVALLNTPEECKAFFEDLCTIKEIQDMSQLFETAVMLSDGHNYQTILSSIGTSTATISRVNRCLQYGTSGYKTAINRLKEKEE